MRDDTLRTERGPLQPVDDSIEISCGNVKLWIGARGIGATAGVAGLPLSARPVANMPLNLLRQVSLAPGQIAYFNIIYTLTNCEATTQAALDSFVTKKRPTFPIASATQQWSILDRFVARTCWDGTLPETRDPANVRSRHLFAEPSAALLAALALPAWQPVA